LHTPCMAPLPYSLVEKQFMVILRFFYGADQ
jgi:hypothetical protein